MIWFCRGSQWVKWLFNHFTNSKLYTNLSLNSFQFNFQAALRVLLVLFVAISSACKKPEFGNELQPESDRLNVMVSDTFTILSTTITQDSVLSDETQFNLCGTLIDPVFGLKKASFAAQPRLLLNNVSFPSGTVVDSMVLVLPYAGAYGDVKKLNGLQQFKVFEVDEDLKQSEAFFSNKNVAIKSQILGQTGFILPRLTDSVTVKGVKEAPQLRIRLSSELAARFIDPVNSPNFANSDLFTSFFKGVLVKAEAKLNQPYSGAVCYFDLTRGGKMVLYYNDSLETNFTFNDASARINLFEHNHSSAEFQLDTLPQANQFMYVQSNAGAITKLRFPFFEKMAQQNTRWILQKAELNAQIDLPSLSNYTPIPNLQVLKLDSTGAFAFLNASATDGTRALYNPATRSYRFDLTTHLQEVLTGRRKNIDVFIVPLAGANQAARVKMFGPASPVRPLKLRLIYQLLN